MFVRFIIKYSFLFLNLICILLLGLSCLSPRISPQTAWVASFIGLLLPLLLLINFFWLVFWLLFKRAFAIIPAVALAAGYGNICKHFSLDCKNKAVLHESFSVMTFNVKVFDLYNWTRNVSSKNGILQLIEEANPDVVCLQEFYTDDSEQFNILGTLRRSYPYFHFHKTLTIDTLHHWGIVTFSKFPLVGREVIAFSNSLHNVCIATDLQIGSDTVRVLNAHLQSIYFTHEDYEGVMLPADMHRAQVTLWRIFMKLKDAFIKRATQAELLRRYISESPYKVLVCSDLNDPPNSYTYRTVSEGLRDSFLEAGCGIGQTYPGRFPFFRIDYILVDERISVRGHKIIPNNISDHYAVMARMEIKH